MAVHPSLLQQFALMRLFSADSLAQLAAYSSTHAFAKREVVLAKENPSSSLMFLLEGRLQAIDFTLDGREVGLHFIEEGQYFGEISVLDGLPSPEVVIATKKSQVVMVPARDIRSHIFGSPQAIEAITSGLTKRIRDQANQRQILGIISPLQRICALLQNLTKEGKNPSLIANAPTHQEIAIMVNLTRETVTRAFQVLQSQGALARDGDDLKVDASKLKQLAEKSAD
ncbi:Crp/Fnr family transcriptional regulator [Limnohabitans sp. 103DPR2]|jgi:CRP-like cAMP-binding protein|uniref:Crp/Fnr family transcriptional regulator n=1 Tax=Limnohabitans sp. 103DPR2 TaxID=1678129 RepID=UPI0009E8E00E|nr:Crp/Fnr family transcriptional regulator [Limnohabitans sp. 103DPR2]